MWFTQVCCTFAAISFYLRQRLLTLILLHGSTKGGFLILIAIKIKVIVKFGGLIKIKINQIYMCIYYALCIVYALTLIVDDFVSTYKCYL